MNRNTHTDVNAQVEAIWTAARDRARGAARHRSRGPVDEALLEDATTEATMRLHRYLEAGGQPPSDPVGWMCLVTWREYLRLVIPHNHRLAGEVNAETTPADDDTLEDLIAEHGDTAIASALEAALDRLSGHQRTVLTDYAHGHSYADIAERHDLSAAAVNKALFRAKRTLRADGRLARETAAWRA